MPCSIIAAAATLSFTLPKWIEILQLCYDFCFKPKGFFIIGQLKKRSVTYQLSELLCNFAIDITSFVNVCFEVCYEFELSLYGRDFLPFKYDF